MKKRQIIRKKKDFYLIFNQGEKIKENGLTIIYFKNPNNQFNRFAFLINKKAVPKASQRNLLRRRFKAICDSVRFKEKECDIILIPKNSMMAKTFTELKALTADLFRRANLI